MLRGNLRIYLGIGVGLHDSTGCTLENLKTHSCFPCSEKFSLDNAAFPFLAYSGIPAVSFCFCEVSLKKSQVIS